MIWLQAVTPRISGYLFSVTPFPLFSWEKNIHNRNPSCLTLSIWPLTPSHGEHIIFLNTASEIPPTLFPAKLHSVVTFGTLNGKKRNLLYSPKGIRRPKIVPCKNSNSGHDLYLTLIYGGCSMRELKPTNVHTQLRWVDQGTGCSHLTKALAVRQPACVALWKGQALCKCHCHCSLGVCFCSVSLLEANGDKSSIWTGGWRWDNSLG